MVSSYLYFEVEIYNFFPSQINLYGFTLHHFYLGLPHLRHNQLARIKRLIPVRPFN